MMKKIGISLLCSLLFCTFYVGCKSNDTDNSIKVEKQYNKAIFNHEYSSTYASSSDYKYGEERNIFENMFNVVDVKDYTISDNNVVYITATDGRKFVCGINNVMLIYDEKGNK